MFLVYTAVMAMVRGSSPQVFVESKYTSQNAWLIKPIDHAERFLSPARTIDQNVRIDSPQGNIERIK